MDARRFDRFAKLVSRRGLAAVLGGGLLAGHASAAQGDRTCGGRPTRLTRFCRTAGECGTDEDCAEGCACVERRIGCCGKLRRKRGRRRRRRICIDGAPRLYCTPAA